MPSRRSSKYRSAWRGWSGDEWLAKYSWARYRETEYNDYEREYERREQVQSVAIHDLNPYESGGRETPGRGAEPPKLGPVVVDVVPGIDDEKTIAIEQMSQHKARPHAHFEALLATYSRQALHRMYVTSGGLWSSLVPNTELLGKKNVPAGRHHGSDPSSQDERVHGGGRRGVKGKANDRDIWAFCDTGAGQNIISARMVKEMHLRVKHRPRLFTMGNSDQVLSLGIVRFEWTFPDDPLNIIKIIAHVLDDFKYDCLLGNGFVQSTKLMTDHVERFVKGVFPSRGFWSMNLLGEISQRVQGSLGSNVPIEALPDIGSSRNIMDESWARSFGFSIRSAAENMGVVVFPDNSTRATIGQVHTTITLGGGAPTPIVFEVLPDCYVPVVLGEDFVFDNDLYTNHASAFTETGDPDSMYDLLPMNYYKKSLISSIVPGRKNSNRGTTTNLSEELPNETEELNRQRKWNQDFSRGRAADQAEWNGEWDRRAEHERRRYPNWEPDEGIGLIEFRPSTQPEPGSSLQPGTFISLATRPMTGLRPRSSTEVNDGRDSVFLQSPSHPNMYPRPPQTSTTADSAAEDLRVDDPGGGPSGSSPSFTDKIDVSTQQSSHHVAEYPSSSSSGEFGAEEQSIWGT